MNSTIKYPQDEEHQEKEPLLLPEDSQSPASTPTPKQQRHATSIPAKLGVALLLLIFGAVAFVVVLPETSHAYYASLRSACTGGHRPANHSVAEAVVAEDQSRFGVVRFDDSSLSIKGQRVFIQSGEFHPWRLPVTDLWRDVLEKVQSGGLNTISIYTHWGLINPSRDVLDFSGINDLELFLNIAREVGLWVIVRPGPYINAETTAGGVPGWVTTIKGNLRTNATDYREAWEPYLRAVCKIVKPFQVSENGNGNVILFQVENELWNHTGQAEHFYELEQVIRSEEITVPLTFNDQGLNDFYASGPGEAKADLYGFDNYPQNFDCSNPLVWSPVNDGYNNYHNRVNPQQPIYIPEFQGGAFDPWGPAAPGYENCRSLTGADFESVFYRGLWASNIKMVSFYMIYGGTNWGFLAFPGVYTSYDYGAAITESRELTPKYTELKRQSLFLRSVRDFASTKIVSDENEAGVAKVVQLRNPDTGAGFYIVRQTNSSSMDHVEFPLTIETKAGTINLAPENGNALRLAGRQSKVITTDLKFGNSELAYTSAGILFAGTIGQRDVLFLYGDVDDVVSLSMASPSLSGSESRLSSTGSATVTPQTSANTLLLSTPSQGISTITTSASTTSPLIIYADVTTAGTFWNPILSPSPDTTLRNFYSFGTNETILVGGPYLVRNASISKDVLHLWGDLVYEKNTPAKTVTVFAPETVGRISWNGVELAVLGTSAADDLQVNTMTSAGALVAYLPTPSFDDDVVSMNKNKTTIKLPELANWVYANSLPEIQSSFDDSDWKVVTKDEGLNNPYPPFDLEKDNLRLYACEQGFCEGATIWRGHFMGEVQEGVKLSLSGGEAFAGSVWLNDEFLGSSFGNSTNNRRIIATTNQTFGFPQGSLQRGKDNVLTVLIDNMGQDEGDEEPKHPRGIQGYALVGGGSFSSWKVQGKSGGNKAYPDRVRGITNEGGFYGERQGWHLPGFDDSEWESRSPVFEGLSAAGAGFFRTSFTLDIPGGFDVPLSFVFDGLDTSGRKEKSYRALLFVNGWQFGRFVSNLGPQTDFPVPQGILDYQGKNTVGVLLWAMGSEGAAIDDLFLRMGDKIYSGGVGPIASNNPQWSPRH